MDAITVGHAKTKLQSLLDEVAASHRPVHIAGKGSAGVLVCEEDWRDIQETLHLLSIPEMRRSIRRGLDTPVEKCARNVKW